MNEFMFTYDLEKNYFEKVLNEFKRCDPTKIKGSIKVIEKKNRVMFNGNATILEIGDFKTVVKCHEADVFNELIGLGLSLSRYYAKQPSTKNEMKYMKKLLDYDKLADYCVSKYFNFDDKHIVKFVFDKVELGKWIEL